MEAIEEAVIAPFIAASDPPDEAIVFDAMPLATIPV